jgi:protein involved in sex pheromone biosynthesis
MRIRKKHFESQADKYDRQFEKILSRLRQREILKHIPVRTAVINGRLTFLTSFLELCN